MKIEIPDLPTCFLCGSQVEEENPTVCSFGLTRKGQETIVMVVCKECTYNAVLEKTGRKFNSLYQKREESDVKK